MVRLTMHISGVKPVFVSKKIKNPDTGKFDFIKKKSIFNTITHVCKNETEGLEFMGNYTQENPDIKVTKYYYTNIL